MTESIKLPFRSVIRFHGQEKVCLNDSRQMFVQPILQSPVDVPQLFQTICLFQQLIIITFKMFYLSLRCYSLRSLLVIYLWLKKDYWFPLCASLLAGLSSISLSLSWAHSVFPTDRDLQASDHTYCTPVNSLETAGFLKWGNKNWQRPCLCLRENEGQSHSLYCLFCL